MDLAFLPPVRLLASPPPPLLYAEKSSENCTWELAKCSLRIHIFGIFSFNNELIKMTLKLFYKNRI